MSTYNPFFPQPALPDAKTVSLSAAMDALPLDFDGKADEVVIPDGVLGSGKFGPPSPPYVPLSIYERMHQRIEGLRDWERSLLPIANIVRSEAKHGHRNSGARAAIECLEGDRTAAAVGELLRADVKWELLAPLMPNSKAAASEHECNMEFEQEVWKERLKSGRPIADFRENSYADHRYCGFAGVGKDKQTYCVWTNVIDPQTGQVATTNIWKVGVVQKWQSRTRAGTNIETVADGFPDAFSAVEAAAMFALGQAPKLRPLPSPTVAPELVR